MNNKNLGTITTVIMVIVAILAIYFLVEHRLSRPPLPSTTLESTLPVGAPAANPQSQP